MSVLPSGDLSAPGAAHGGASDGAAALIAESRKARADKTWIITDGSVGMEAQGIAVAEAVGLPFTLKRVRAKGLMRLLPAPIQILVPARGILAATASSEKLEPPWPRLIISIGRRSVPIALAIKRLSGAYALHIQNPKVPARLFDLVAAPAGVRAQAVARDGRLLDDFELRETDRAVHVLNAPSPAATASLVIGRTIAERLVTRL